MKATYATSLHQVDQAKASLAKVDDDLAKTTILSPMEGTVTRLRSQRGERVVGTALMAGTEIMTVADLNEMEARVDISETDVVLISLGQIARLEVDAFRDRKFSGTVTEIANSSKGLAPAGSAAGSFSSSQQQEATKFEVKIHIREKELFRPGMSVTAEIETRYRTNVLCVPIQSVTTRSPEKPGNKQRKPASEAQANAASSSGANSSNSGTAKKPGATAKPIEVAFVAEGEQVRMVPVKRGIGDDAYVEVVEGLTEGQEIVSGSYKAINRELEDQKKIKRGEPDRESDKQKGGAGGG
jgi:HlyD family secretion protein